MNTVGWEIIYNSGEQIRIEKMLKGLYEAKDWEELHGALWAWLSLDGEREKEEWFVEFNVPEVQSYCFACEQAKEYLVCEQSGNYCDHCPLTKWTAIGCLGGVYEQWLKADFKTRESLAEKIANMKWLY